MNTTNTKNSPRLIVEIFERPGYQGKRGAIIEPIKFTGDIGFQDNISSIRVYKGPGYASSPNYKAIFHEHINFQGRQLVLGPGFYPNIADVAYNFGNKISSVNFGPSLQTSGPEFGSLPLIVEVYERPNYQGKRATVLRDISHTETIGLHDAIHSIKVFRGPNFPPGGCKVTFYEHIDFEGSMLAIQLGPLEYHKEIADLNKHLARFGGIISSIKIDSWHSASPFTELAFQDQFDGVSMRPEWRWVDPKGGGAHNQSRQGYLEMKCEPGQDLWHGNPPGQGGNMDAPRLLQTISGDFAVEIKMTISRQLREHGGILVWKNENAFVRLEKTSGPHGFKGDVRFERHVSRVYSLVGRGEGLTNVPVLYLRLERQGNVFSAFASADSTLWQSCGTTVVGMTDPVEVGMHALCPGNIPPTITRFDYFRILRKKSV